MRRRKRSTSLFEVLNSSKPDASKPAAPRAETPEVREEPTRSRIHDVVEHEPVEELRASVVHAAETPPEPTASEPEWTEDEFEVVHEEPLPAIPLAESSQAGFDEPPTFWAWLNTTEEFRRMTLVVGSVVIVLMMCLAFESGQSLERSRHGVAPEEVGYTPIGIMDPSPYDGDEKPPVRNVNPAVSQDDLEGQGERGDVVHRTVEEDTPVAPPEKVWIVAISTTEDTASGTKVVRYLRRMVPFTANLRRSSSSGDRQVFEVYVGSFDDSDEAEQALRRVRSLPRFQGTDFAGAYLRKVEHLNNADTGDIESGG